MSKRRSLHPSYVLLGVLSTFKALLPVLLITLFKGIEWSEIRWYWFAGIGGGIAVLLLMSYLTWRRFGFWLEEDRIIIRSGLLFRDEKTIYYTRIHSVNVEQPLLQRLLGVAQVKIETPGGSKKADGVLPALSLKEANEIRHLLRMRGQSAGEAAERGAVEITHDTNVAEKDMMMPAGEAAPSMRLSSIQLFQAAATSMNFGLAAAFMAGLYSLADDFIELVVPDRLLKTVVEESTNYVSNYVLIAAVAVIVLLFAWLLSIFLYIIKYSGFTMKREGKQISLSYGLFDKKTFLFDPKKVQAVIVNEGLLRQPFGYAEVKLQVISSDKQEQLMLHPFVKRSQIAELLHDFVPQMKVPSVEHFAFSPRRALLYYIRNQMLFVLSICIGCIAFFQMNGVWSLLLVPLVAWWRICCHRAAAMKLENQQLTLRNRWISRSTYYIRRPQIVTMKVKRSIGQQRKQLLTLSVHVLGSPFAYKAACLERSDVEPVWRWYSRGS